MSENKTSRSDYRNIFQSQKVDGAVYLLLYIVIPVAITYISLKTFRGSNNTAIYCYVTILVSALNSIYDAASRWIPKQKTLKNGKLFLIMFSSAIIAFYCIYITLTMLITNKLDRCDYILLFYAIAVTVALVDLLTCILKEVEFLGGLLSKSTLFKPHFERLALDELIESVGSTTTETEE